MNFEINFNETKNNINEINSAIKNYKMTMSSLKGRLLNVDGYWKDNNTDVFIEAVKKDYIVYNEHIDSVKTYINCIENFCEDLKKKVSNKTNIKVISKIKLSEESMTSVISALGDVYTYISNCVDYLQNLSVPANFVYKWKINEYLSDFRYYRTKVNSLKNELKGLNDEIVELLNEYKLKISKYDNVSINKDTMKYKWNIYADSLKKNEININDKSVSVNSNVVTSVNLETSEMTVTNDNNYVVSNSNSVSEIETKEKNIEKNGYIFGSNVNNEIIIDEQEMDKNDYFVNQNIKSQDMNFDNDTLVTVPGYVIGKSENETIVENKYDLNSEKYVVNQNISKDEINYNNNTDVYDNEYNVSSSNNVNLEHSDIKTTDYDYSVNETVTSNSDFSIKSDFDIKDFEAKETSNGQNLTINSTDVNANSYDAPQSNSRQNLSGINVDVGVKEYSINNDSSQSDLRVSNVEVKKGFDNLDLNS